jgi:hypothetical protein
MRLKKPAKNSGLRVRARSFTHSWVARGCRPQYARRRPRTRTHEAGLSGDFWPERGPSPEFGAGPLIVSTQTCGDKRRSVMGFSLARSSAFRMLFLNEIARLPIHFSPPAERQGIVTMITVAVR